MSPPADAMTSGAWNFLISAPAITLPIGPPPLSARLKTLITRPRMLSGVISWTNELIIAKTDIRAIPAKKIMAQENATEGESANATVKTPNTQRAINAFRP
jgi:hypothetical protein